jgi:hypothetical protein
MTVTAATSRNKDRGAMAAQHQTWPTSSVIKRPVKKTIIVVGMTPELLAGLSHAS